MTVAKSGPANRERVYGIDPRGRAFEVQIDVGCYSGRQILAMRARLREWDWGFIAWLRSVRFDAIL